MIHSSKQNLHLILKLRWFAILGQTLVILATHYFLDYSLSLFPLFALVAVLILVNIGSYLFFKPKKEIKNPVFFLQLFLDVLIFTGLLFVAGGASNPFTGLYMIQVIIAATLLPWRYCWSMVGLSIVGYLSVASFGQDLGMSHHAHHGGHGQEMVSRFMDLHMQGMIISYALSAILVAYFVVKMAENLRAERERLSQLEGLMQKESTLTKVGLIAAGAAHEMNTPLSTLSMASDELKESIKDTESKEIIHIMDHQINRCKTSLSQILSSFSSLQNGEEEKKELGLYLETVFQSWRNSHPHVSFSITTSFSDQFKVQEDTLFEMVLFNLSDNAAAVSSDIKCEIAQKKDNLFICISDSGPGLSDEVARYVSENDIKKDASLSGMGLYLSKTILQRMKGHLSYKREKGRSLITVTVPLSSLTKEVVFG